MNKMIYLVIGLLVLIPAVTFGGGTKEAVTTVDEMENELGDVIDRRFEMTNPRTGEKGTTVTIDRFKAAPMLKGRVEAGELPPVDQRVPAEPLVLKPIESIGQYGGTMVHLRGTTHVTWNTTLHLLEHLVTWTGPYFEELNPNVAKAWDVSPDAKTTTFYLREGMMWSDGTPFTADAIVWWFEHIIKNDDLFPSKPSFLLTRGNLPTVTKVDETTVRFSFTDTNPMFLANAARIRPMPYAPAHYLEQFHPDFVSSAEIDRLVREGDYDRWTNMFMDKWDFYANPDVPAIGGWIPVNHAREEVQRFERNPYYWKVDTEGNQLPYIDEIEHPFVTDAQAFLLRAMAGELTHARGALIGGRPNIPLLMENRERGGYNIVPSYWIPNNLGVINLNFGHPDEVKRELINDRRFRMALLKAIDHDEVNQVIYEGEANPSWPVSSDHFGRDHELYFRYIGRDVDGANALLDDMGLTSRDREGYRLGPDGRSLTLICLVQPAPREEMPEVAEFYRSYFRNIGLRMVVRIQSAQLLVELTEAGDYDLILTTTAPGGGPLNIFERGTLMPAGRNWGISRPWARWLLSNGEEGIEPPEHVKRLRELHEAGMTEPSAELRDAMIEEALEIWVENLLVIPGYSEPWGFAYVLYKDNLRNAYIEGEMSSTEFHTTPSQIWYFE